jgi:uncharacterized protein (DUF736 family)
LPPIVTRHRSGRPFQRHRQDLSRDGKMRLVPSEGTAGQGPSFLMGDGAADIGRGWKRCGESKRDYISGKLDALSLPNPFYASLFPADEPDTHTLLWYRPKAK